MPDTFDLSKNMKIDSAKEEGGVWIAYKGGSQLLIARHGNKKHEAAYERMLKPYQRGRRGGTIPEDVLENVGIRCLARYILLDWKGIADEGKELPYSPEAAERLFRKYPLLMDDVFAFSQKAETFLVEEEEEIAGNSESSSAGS